MIDREKARAVLDMERTPYDGDADDIIDALEACVVPDPTLEGASDLAAILSRRVVAIEARVAAALALHQRTNAGWCQTCGHAWPCATRRALEVTA